jgi:hypothetical protein
MPPVAENKSGNPIFFILIRIQTQLKDSGSDLISIVDPDSVLYTPLIVSGIHFFRIADTDMPFYDEIF